VIFLHRVGAHAGDLHARAVVVCGAGSARSRLRYLTSGLLAMGEPIIDGSPHEKYSEATVGLDADRLTTSSRSLFLGCSHGHTRNNLRARHSHKVPVQHRPRAPPEPRAQCHNSEAASTALRDRCRRSNHRRSLREEYQRSSCWCTGHCNRDHRGGHNGLPGAEAGCSNQQQLRRRPQRTGPCPATSEARRE
jgi:hypothetical protein